MIEYKGTSPVQRTLGEPVFIYFTQETIHSRRNLILLSFIALIYSCSGAEIGDFHPLGIQFREFDATYIDLFFIGAVIYSLVHFLWLSLDALQEWRIRLTGTKTAFITVARPADKRGDYPSDPRQSSLMTWWTTQAEDISDFEPLATTLEENLKAPQDLTSEKQLSSDSLQKQAIDLKSAIDKLIETLQSERIPESLGRFERWYKMFSYSQLLRFVLLGWGFPVLLGIWALWGFAPYETIFKAT